MIKNISKKGEINQVFVYLLSIMLILFIGFLVIKFITSFGSSVDTKIETQIYSDLKKDFTNVYKTYGSEKVLKYKLPQEVKNICFISNSCDVDNTLSNLNNDEKNSLKIVIDSGDNVALFSNSGIINKENIGEFIPKNNCFCVKPNNLYLYLIMENRKNKVYIFQD